jgi:hypothetical protein
MPSNIKALTDLQFQMQKAPNTFRELGKKGVPLMDVINKIKEDMQPFLTSKDSNIRMSARKFVAGYYHSLANGAASVASDSAQHAADAASKAVLTADSIIPKKKKKKKNAEKRPNSSPLGISETGITSVPLPLSEEKIAAVGIPMVEDNPLTALRQIINLIHNEGISIPSKEAITKLSSVPLDDNVLDLIKIGLSTTDQKQNTAQQFAMIFFGLGAYEALFCRNGKNPLANEKPINELSRAELYAKLIIYALPETMSTLNFFANTNTKNIVTPENTATSKLEW